MSELEFAISVLEAEADSLKEAYKNFRSPSNNWSGYSERYMSCIKAIKILKEKSLALNGVEK